MRTLRGADFVSIPDLVARRNHAHLIVDYGIERPVDILNRATDNMLSREHAVQKSESGGSYNRDRRGAHRKLPHRKTARQILGAPRGLPYRLHFAIAGQVDRVAAGHALVHMIFKQQSPRIRQILVEVGGNERLKILAAAQW